MESEDKIEVLLQQMTEDQKDLFFYNLELWKKTVQLNGRPQHFDSFDVDKSMVIQDWYYFLEDLNTLEFEENITRCNSLESDENYNSDKTFDHFEEIETQNSSITPTLRFEILQRDGFRCQLCGATAKHRSRLEIDHKIPKKHGGTDSEENLWTLCFNCNRGKGAKSI